MQVLELVDLDRVDSIDGCDKWVLVGIDMLEVGWQRPDHVFDLSVTHCLHQELLVLGEKEEATTSTCSPSCVLDLFYVLGRFNWPVEFRVLDIVWHPDAFKGLCGVLLDDDVSSELESSKRIWQSILQYVPLILRWKRRVEQNVARIQMVQVLHLLRLHEIYPLFVKVHLWICNTGAPGWLGHGLDLPDLALLHFQFHVRRLVFVHLDDPVQHRVYYF